ncbi:MAG: YdcF family protein [Bacteroidales bacterium]|nr:YdcF family protein [Bacteroidales bacterium]
MKLFFKYSWLALLILISSVVIFILFANILVELRTKDAVYDNITSIKHNKVGLLLGTGKYLNNGYINLYYKNRLDAAEALFKAGKIDYILVSGDNSSQHYDEPTTIKKDLIKRGIPAKKIYLDYAGFRTLDSVIRSKAIFGQTNITVISQEFHIKRAIYIAGFHDIQAIGYKAGKVSHYYGFKTKLREKLARVKMLLDLIFSIEPKYYGDPVIIQ